MSRRFASLVAVVLLAAVTLVAQNGTQVFREDVAAVRVDVTVLNNRGVPVSTLKAADFSVEIDGKMQPVQSLEYVQFASAVDQPVSAAVETGGGTRGVPAPRERVGRSVLVAVDDLSFMRLDAKRLTDSAAQWVGALDPADRVGLITTSGLGPNLPLTTSRAAVIAALRGRISAQKPPLLDTTRFRLDDVFNGPGNARTQGRLTETADRCVVATLGGGGPQGAGIVGDDPRDPCERDLRHEMKELSYLIERTSSDQIEAYTRFVRQLERMPSPRILLVISDGLPLNGGTGYAATFRRVAAEAGVQLFALTPDVMPEGRLSEDAMELPVEASLAAGTQWLKLPNGVRAELRTYNATLVKNGLSQVVDVAGGETLRVRGDPGLQLDRLLTRLSGFYRLGVTIPPASVAKPSLAVKVRVRGTGLSVKTATRIARSTAPEPKDERTVPQRLSDLVRVGTTADGVPVELATTIGRDLSGGLVRVTATVLIPAGRSGPFSAAVAMANETDGLVRGGSPAIPVAPAPGEEVRTSFSFAVPAGRYHLRVAVADGTGRIGTAEQGVVARLRPLGELYASDMRLSWSRDQSDWRPIGFDDLPRAATAVRVEMELYTPGPLTTVAPIHLAIFKDGGEKPIGERDVMPVITGTTAEIVVDFPAGSLEPGAYEVKAAVAAGGTPLGSLSATFRKRAETSN